MSENVGSSTGKSRFDLAELYRRTHDRLLRAAIRMGAGADEAQDLVQASFLIAHQRIDDFEGRSEPFTWLLGILFNHHRNHRRGIGRALCREQAYAVLEVVGPERRICDAYVACLLEEVLAELDPEQRRLLLLWSEAGMSVREIALQLHLNINTTYSRLSAARRQVRDVVEVGAHVLE